MVLTTTGITLLIFVALEPRAGISPSRAVSSPCSVPSSIGKASPSFSSMPSSLCASMSEFLFERPPRAAFGVANLAANSASFRGEKSTVERPATAALEEQEVVMGALGAEASENCVASMKMRVKLWPHRIWRGNNKTAPRALNAQWRGETYCATIREPQASAIAQSLNSETLVYFDDTNTAPWDDTLRDSCGRDLPRGIH